MHFRIILLDFFFWWKWNNIIPIYVHVISKNWFAFCILMPESLFWILTDVVKQMLLSVQRLERDLGVGNFVISNDYDYNDIQNRAELIHEPNLLEHFYYEMDSVANHLQPHDYVDDANHTWEIMANKC